MERHLNLADLHIGDWVYEYSDITERPSCPMYVSALFEDGTVYLNFNGNEADIWEAEIKDIRPIIIDEDILKGFGFKNGDVQQERVLKYGDTEIVFNIDPNMMTFYVKHADGRTSFAFGCFFVHTLQKLYYEHTRVPLVLEWKGV